MTGDILVLSERSNGELAGITYELVAKGREVADQLGVKLAILILGHNLDSLAKTLAGVGVDTVLVADHSSLDQYNTEPYYNVISDVIRDFKPSMFFVGYDYQGIEVGAAIAAQLGATMASDCIDLELANGVVRVTRPAYGGTIHVKIELQGEPPCVISFQKGAISAERLSPRDAEVQQIPVEFDEAALRTKVVGLVEAAVGDIDITKADIIVSVGKGIGNKDNIRLAQELADALGGVVASSRPLADSGWLPRERHVGMSGKTVTPKVYLACGISGASQHVVGMRDSHLIIALNKDANAPIFGVAHYGIVGDILEILPALTKEAQMLA